jgi:hypothetical protein
MKRTWEIVGIILIFLLFSIIAGLLLEGAIQFGGDPSCATQGVC